MKTAVEWFEKELQKNFNIEGIQMLYDDIFYQAKEMEKQQQDEFAIGFANWIRVCKLKGRPYDFENIKELLIIYKEEKGL
jgi:hypothetical protein